VAGVLSSLESFRTVEWDFKNVWIFSKIEETFRLKKAYFLSIPIFMGEVPLFG